MGHVGECLCRARSHAGLPVRAAGRATAGAAPHAAGRAGGRTLCHRAGHAGQSAPGVPEHEPPGQPLCTRSVRIHRGDRFHRLAPDAGRHLHAGGHLHGPPPGHDHRGADQRAARRRGAALGHGAPESGSGVLAAARTCAARPGGAGAPPAAQPAAEGLAAPRAGPCACGGARRAGAGALAPAVQRALQREPARQRRGLEPVGCHRHHALARRCLARCLRQLRVRAPGAQRVSGLGEQPSSTRPRCALPEHFPHRPRGAGGAVARAARADHRVGEP
ncbi:hypothetical protein FQZ97_826740 [compost metagenome]